jgi:hypothetical protein
LKSNDDSTKQLKWKYTSRISRLYEVSSHAAFNVLVASVRYYDGTFVTMIHNKTDLLSRPNVEAQCDDTKRIMERWMADEVDSKLTRALGEI